MMEQTLYFVSHGNASNTFQFFEMFVNCLLHTGVSVWKLSSDKIWKSCMDPTPTTEVKRRESVHFNL